MLRLVNKETFSKNSLFVRHFTSSISSDRLKVNDNPSKGTKPFHGDLKFGHTFTDHMLSIDYTDANGWSDPVIGPYEEMRLSPAAPCLHLGVQCFEGLKAYKDKKGVVRMFRPELNMQRLESSMVRMGMPSIGDGNEFLRCIYDLVRKDADWIPSEEGYSMYIRPAAIATSPALGLRRPSDYKLFCILSPVGPYYPTGFQPVKLYADTSNVRAWPGGVGAVKVGGNYGPTIKPMEDVKKHDCTSILWLHGEDHQITEVGAMNIFFVLKMKDGKTTELVTAPLTRGDILPGVTRDSILSLARLDEGKDLIVSERFINMGELVEAYKEGRFLESFGVGTAAVISPVKSILYNDLDMKLPSGDNAGPVAQKMWDTLYDIQYGKVDHPWSIIL